jgi:hypothetical protein
VESPHSSNELTERNAPKLSPRQSAWRWILAIIGLGLVSLTFVQPNSTSEGLSYAIIGYLYGTMLSLTTLAAAWAVLGTGKLMRRMMLSALLVLAVTLAVSTNLTLHEQSEGALLFLVVIGTVLFGQWLFAQVPLWFLAIAYGLRLTILHDEQADVPHTTRQFGIRQLMTVTAIVAVVLGIGRVLVGWLMRDDEFLSDSGQVFVIIGFIAATGVISILPLVLAMFLSRGAAIAAIRSLVFLGLASWAAGPLFRVITKAPAGSGPEYLHFLAINAVQAAWVIAIAALLRWAGNRLMKTSASVVSP